VLIAKRSTSANPRLTASVEYSCEEYLRRRNIVAKYRFAHHGLCAQQFASRCREASFIDCGDEGTKLIERDTVQHEPTLRAIDHADGNSRNIPVIPDLDQVSMSPWDAKGGHRLVPTVGFDLLYGLVIVRLDRRDLIWIDVTANPMAECKPIAPASPGRTADRIDPPGVSGPRHCPGRGASAPRSENLTLATIRRRARTWPWIRTRPIAHREEGRAHSLPPNLRRIASRICSDLIFDRHKRSEPTESKRENVLLMPPHRKIGHARPEANVVVDIGPRFANTSLSRISSLRIAL
jgi:hypothetical protein